MNKCVIIGGGTFNKVACHLALATPAFGSTAKHLKEIIDSWGLEDDIETQLVLTKMADSRSQLVTNEDVGKYLATLATDRSVKAVIMNAALCDFTMENPSADSRLSSQQDYYAELIGDRQKLIATLKEARPDIFVVAFKTTHNDTMLEQVSKGFNLLQTSGADLVLANDVGTYNNVLLSKDLAIHTGERSELLITLADLVVDDIKEGRCYQYV